MGMSWGKQTALGFSLLTTGYLVGSIAPLSFSTDQSRAVVAGARSALLAEGFGSEDGVDYAKLARVCLVAAGHKKASQSRTNHHLGSRRNSLPDGGPSRSRGAQLQGNQAQESAAAIQSRKAALDRIMVRVMDEGQWSAKASRAALRARRELPAVEVASFEALLLSAIAEGHLSVEPSAWVPEKVEDSGD